jgi:hypothetical protein
VCAPTSPSAWSAEARRRLPASARCLTGYHEVVSIAEGRARGPPTMSSLTMRYQPGLVRRFLERAYLGRSVCVVSNQGSGAAGGAPIPTWHSGTSWTRAPPPGRTRGCGPPSDGSPAPSAHAVSRRERDPRFHLIGHICRGLICSARSGALARSVTALSISANEHRLTPR